MGNYEQLKNSIEEVIKTNGNQEITGQILQNVLKSIVSTLGANATFAGIATPNTNPGTPDGPMFYIASEPGVYANFGSVRIVDTICIFHWLNGVWTTKAIDAFNKSAINEKIFNLSRKTDHISKEIVDSEEEFISVEDDENEELLRLDTTGLNAKNVKSNGYDVLTENDIPRSFEIFEEDEQIFSSDDYNESTGEGESYVKIGKYGIKAKNILDINGNPMLGGVNIPGYFEEEIATTANSIKNIATTSSTIFNIVTDTHERYWESEDVKAYDVSFENIKRVNSIRKSNALVHLGDIIVTSDASYFPGKYESQDVINAHLKAFFDRMRAAHENSVIMLGNHEDLNGQGAKGGDAKSIYPNIAIYDYSCNRYKNRPFFYIDNAVDKVRSIFLCCPYQWEGKQNWHFGQEQINWLIDTALNVSDNWHCIFFSHTPLFSADMISASDYADIAGVINAFNNHTSFTTSYSKVANFSNKVGTKSVAWICGHEHYDLVVQPNDKTVYPNNNLSCPIITIACHFRFGAEGNVPGATYYNTAMRIQDNKNKDLWDTLIYRKDQAKIYMIRFGAGEDRIINV